MKRYKIHKGDVFGNWTIIDDSVQRASSSRAYALARCRCGNEKYASLDHMTAGTKWCSKCYVPKRNRWSTKKYVIHVGDVYGCWTVLDDKPIRTSPKHRKYLCRCSCGNISHVDAFHLYNKTHMGCGKCHHGGTLGNRNPNFTGYKNYAGGLFYQMKRNAKNRGIPFEVSKKEVYDLFEAQQKKCALTGLPIQINSGGKSGHTASLDRVDGAKGYSTSNIQWVHKDVNRMKMCLPEDRLVELCRLICKHRKVKL